MDFVQLGRRIRDERLLMRLTLEKLAERTNKSINFIGQIERGEGRPSVETLVDIANALDTTVDSLLRDSVKASDDTVARELTGLVREMDEAGRQFILDMAKRYVYYHVQR